MYKCQINSMPQSSECKLLKSNSTSDIQSNKSLDIPSYLTFIKSNIEFFLFQSQVLLIKNDGDSQQKLEETAQSYSMIITKPNLIRSKYQIYTQCVVIQDSYRFKISSYVTINDTQLAIKDRDNKIFNIKFLSRINSALKPLQIVMHPFHGTISFQTDMFLHQKTLSTIKKCSSRSECIVTQMVITAMSSAEKYIDLLLFAAGEINIQQVIQNPNIAQKFSFLLQCEKILTQLEKSLFYMHLLPMDNITMKKSQVQKSNLIQQLKGNIIFNSLTFFQESFEKITKHYDSRYLYSNINFSVSPLAFKPTSYSTILNMQKSTSYALRLVTYIEIINDPLYPIQWLKITEGGFGIIQVASVKYKNLSSSFCQPETGDCALIRQNLVRKIDRIFDIKKSKIARQRSVLQRLKCFFHPNIMSFYLSIQPQYQNCLFSEYTPNMSLDYYVKKSQNTLPIERKLHFIIEAIQGLKFLHKFRIVHLDIKPGNIILSKRCRVLLSDFGQAFIQGQDDPITHRHAYTVPYCAPQIFYIQPQITQKVDTYAIGITILKLIVQQNVFDIFLRNKFIKKLNNSQLQALFCPQKLQNSVFTPILKIITFLALKLINPDPSLRVSLDWVNHVLKECQNYLQNLIYQ